jgi:hypothetical protein
MGRRSRQRAKDQTANEASDAPPRRRDRMARVAVADDVWADFRAAAGHRAISEVLGELVEREVARYRSQRLRDGQVDSRELLEALDRARQQQEDLAALVARLEALRPLTM